MFSLLSWRTIIGVTLLLLAWLDPFAFGLDFVVVTFILGFDLIPLVPKIFIFILDFWLKISGVSIFLLFQLIEEIVFSVFKLGKLINMIVKPTIIFIIILINGFSVWLALVIALIDFLLNMESKLI